MSQLCVYLGDYFSFWTLSTPSCLSCPWSSFDGCTQDFTIFWIFMMTCLLKVLCFTVCWKQHTKVSVFLVYKCLLLWCILYCRILKPVIDVIKRSIIVWRIQFIECSDDGFVCVFMMILFCLILLFYKIIALDNLLCVLSHPRILLGLNVLFSAYV